MKKLILCLTVAAFATVSLQAGEGKECATACTKATQVTKAGECSKTAKAAECSKLAKRANPTGKGATLLIAKR